MIGFSNALVLGAAGGLGAAFAAHLRPLGPVHGLSRSDGLDFSDPARAEGTLLEMIARAGPFDLVIDATGALVIGGAGPEKKLSAIDPAAMMAQFAVNAVGPALVLKHYDALLFSGAPSVFATLSARVGSIGDNRLGGWIGYRSAKAALNQIVRTAAIEIARTRPDAICVALHPGTVNTPLSAPFVGTRDTFSPEDAAQRMLVALGALSPADTGCFFAYDGTKIVW